MRAKTMLAATVAKRIHAPHAHIFFETGGIGPLLEANIAYAVLEDRAHSEPSDRLLLPPLRHGR